MARANTIVLLPLDSWAEYMAINPCAWNQVYNPTRPYPADCNDVWLQHGYTGGADRILGREDVARAIATAERMVARTLGFRVAPTWEEGEQQTWPVPKRGAQIEYPPILPKWGYIIAGGREALDEIVIQRAVIYTDEDGDGVDDAATITVTAAEMTAATAPYYEVAVYYPAEYLDFAPYPRNEQWRIKPLQITRHPVSGDITIRGNRCQFVRPDLWLDDDPIDLSVDANFLAYVDVYRRYTDPSQPAQLVWFGGAGTCVGPTCAESCQTACLQILDERPSTVHAIAGTYSAGAWTGASFQYPVLPNAARLWYLAGYHEHFSTWIEADWMVEDLAEAITRLANVYLPEAACGCAQTRLRWQRDREEQKIDNVDAALCMSAFGTTARGALFAWSVIKRLGPMAGPGVL